MSYKAYKPKIVLGKVTGTGYPIDGHALRFSQWDYDNREWWHLYGWDMKDDEAVMLTMYQAEKEDWLGTDVTLEAFTEKWKANEWEPAAAFCLPLDKVEVLEVLQEEEREIVQEEKAPKKKKRNRSGDNDAIGCGCALWIIAVAACLACAYFIATSDLPDWLKFYLLK